MKLIGESLSIMSVILIEHRPQRKRKCSYDYLKRSKASSGKPNLKPQKGMIAKSSKASNIDVKNTYSESIYVNVLNGITMAIFWCMFSLMFNDKKVLIILLLEEIADMNRVSTKTSIKSFFQTFKYELFESLTLSYSFAHHPRSSPKWCWVFIAQINAIKLFLHFC